MSREHGREEKEYQCCRLFVCCSAVLELKLEQGRCLLDSLPLRLCFPLPLLLVVLLSCSCPYSFHLSCFFTHRLNSVILTFLCLRYLLPNPLPFSLLSTVYLHQPFFLCLSLCSSLCFSLPLSNPLFNSVFLPLPCPPSVNHLPICLSFSSLLFLPHPSSLLHY